MKLGAHTLAYLRTLRRQGPHIMMFRNKRVQRIDTGWSKAVTNAGLDDSVNLYSLRHTCARYLRMHGVDTMEIAAMLGHRKVGFDITMRYMPHSPDYLKRSVDILDELVSFCVRA